MVKKHKFRHHPMIVEKELMLGEIAEEEHVSPIQLEKLSAALTSAASVDDIKWTLMDIGALAVAAAITVPRNAVAAVLEVEVNDGGSAGAACYMSFCTPGNLGDTGKISNVYCGNVNDRKNSRIVIVELNDDDKIAYTIVASGAVFDYVIKLNGWLIAGTNQSKASMPYADLKAEFVVS